MKQSTLAESDAPRRAGRPRKFADNLCIRCRQKPRPTRVVKGKTVTESYCKACNNARRRDLRNEFSQPGDSRFKWRSNGGQAQA